MLGLRLAANPFQRIHQAKLLKDRGAQLMGEVARRLDRILQQAFHQTDHLVQFLAPIDTFGDPAQLHFGCSKRLLQVIVKNRSQLPAFLLLGLSELLGQGAQLACAMLEIGIEDLEPFLILGPIGDILLTQNQKLGFAATVQNRRQFPIPVRDAPFGMIRIEEWLSKGRVGLL